ncbi:MAG TPA: hypothetical protein DCO77_11100 [Nitrospiraceae bacterium]|nr:hypothetical protein [Nitrospiraceae bacterium]
MNDEPKKIRGIDLLKVFFRALLIQASWSFDLLQSMGFAYAMLPVLRKLYPDKAEFASRLNLHTEYFNTQPYLASFILGAAVKMEEDRAFGRNDNVDSAEMKSALMAPLGAVGDGFFWAALKPFAATIAVSLLIVGVWWAPLLYLLLYNVWHVGLRINLLFLGYRSGGDAVALIERHNFSKLTRLFKASSLSVLGGMLGTLTAWRPEFRLTVPLSGPLTILFGAAFTLVLIEALRRGGSPIKLMLGLAAVCLALAYAGVP